MFIKIVCLGCFTEQIYTCKEFTGQLANICIPMWGCIFKLVQSEPQVSLYT